MLSAIIVFSQDSAWKKMIIDETLTISFPGSVTKIDTSLVKEGKKWRFKAYKYDNGASTFALIVTPGEVNMNVDNKETWKKALTEISKGALKSFSQKGFSCSPSDTTIDKIPCKKVTCTNEDISMLNSYLFLVNDKLYSLQYASLDQETVLLDTSQLKLFLNSVHFKKDAIKEMQFESKAFSDGYKFGYVLGSLIVVVGIVLVIMFFVRRAKRL